MDQRIFSTSSSIEEAIAKIDAVTERAVRDFAGRMAGQAGAAMALYGPADAAPTLEALRERLAA